MAIQALAYREATPGCARRREQGFVVLSGLRQAGGAKRFGVANLESIAQVMVLHPGNRSAAGRAKNAPLFSALSSYYLDVVDLGT